MIFLSITQFQKEKEYFSVKVATSRICSMTARSPEVFVILQNLSSFMDETITITKGLD